MRSFALAVSLLLTACPPPEGPPPKTGPQPPASQEDNSTKPGKVSGQLPVPSADIGSEVILTITVNNPDTVLTQGLSYVRPHLPAAFAAMLQPSMLKTQLFKAAGMPQLEAVVDTTRPWALAVVDPEQHHGGGQLGSTMVALPVNDPQGMADALGQEADQHERTPWNDHLLTFGGQQLRLRFAEGYALLATNEKLINGAGGVLLPLVKTQGAGAGRLRLDLATVNRLYGAKLDQSLQRMRRKMGRKGPQLAGVAKMVTRWVGYLRSMEQATLDVELDQANIRALATLVATASGEFPTYLSKLRPGPAWGAAYLPAESAAAFVSRQSPTAMIESVEEGVELLRGMLGQMVPDKTFNDLRDLGRRSAKHFTGESAGAMWVNADGGVGMGMASRVQDPALARAEMLKLLQLISGQVRRVLTQSLPAEVRRELKGLGVELKVRPGALRVAGAQGDLIELNIRWPKLKGQADKELQQTRKRLAKVLGPRLTLAMVGTKDVLLLTAGKDHRQRMTRMVAVASGGGGRGLKQTIASIVGSRRIVGLVYVPVASMAEQVMRLAEQLTTVPAQVKDVFQKLLPPPGHSVPVSAVVQTSSPKMTVELNVSPDLMGMVAKGVMAAMTPRGGP